MGALIQLFKDFFLLATTVFLTIWFLYDYQKGFSWYLLLYAIIAVIGFNRVLYNENFFIPLLISISVLIQKNQKVKISILYTFLFIQICIVTWLNNLSITNDSSGGIYLFVVLLIFSEYLFNDANQVTKIVFLIWLITIGFALNSLIFGEHLLSAASIDSEERALVLNNGLAGSSANDQGIDLNYFGCTQAIGALITIMFINYRNDLINNIKIPFRLRSIIRSWLFGSFLFLLLALQVWLVLRGISRGALVAFLAGILTYLLTLKKFKYLLYGGILLFILFLVANQLGINKLFAERIAEDSSGTSGRNFIWLAILRAVYQHGGIIQIIFGGGIGWPWWRFWTENFWDTGVVPSTHNQWLALYTNVGLLGLVLFFVPIINGLKNNIRNNNPINNIRIVLFACVFTESLSLEPLQFDRYVWFLLALVTTSTPNIKIGQCR